MHAPDTSSLERSAALARLAPQTAGLVATPDCRGLGGQRGRLQSVDGTGPRSRPRGAPSPASPWGPAAAVSRPTRPPARAVAAWARSLWLSWSAVDPYAHRRRHPPGVWCLLSSAPCGPRVPRHALDPATAHPPRPPARRRGHCPVARRDLAGPQKGAEAQEQPLLFIGESGFSPLPSVVRTYAPVGQPPSYGTGAPAIISRP
jgi:hypothetical protein